MKNNRINILTTRRRLCTSLVMLALGGAVWASDVVRLQAEYMDTPLGIDVPRPRLSWQLQADRYGARQTAYRLMVATSTEALAEGDCTWDTGRVESDQSVGVVYAGPALHPATRYYWQVTLWDERGEQATSVPTWLETGLMGSDWQGAQWVGSREVDLSRYRSRFTIDYDFTLAKGSSQATFVLGGKSEQQYVSLTLIAGDEPRLVVARTQDGVEQVDFTQPLDLPLGVEERHHVSVDVSGPHSYSMHVSVDGQPVKNTRQAQGGPGAMMFGPPDEYAFDVRNDTDDEPNANSRLYQIGFRQAQGQTATFSGIVISENAWDTTLYTDTEVHTVSGNGQPQLWQPAAEVAAPMLRKAFTVDRPVRQARLYATARGAVDCYLSGQRVSDERLSPGWTDFRKRIMYRTYDVTALLHQGQNALGAVLGIGWYGDQMGFNPTWQDQYGVRPSMMALLVVDYADGTRQTVTTDGTWRCTTDGPVMENSLFNGEDYDARREIDGWSQGDFDDAAWPLAAVFDAPAETVVLQGYVGLPIRSTVTLQAQSVRKVGERNYVYDLGQNIAGVPRLKGLKGQAGQTVTIHFAEMLYPDAIPTEPVAPYTVEMYRQKRGQLYRENYRSALSTDRYTLRGRPEGETCEPRFTYHGFRYLSVEGLDEPLPLECVEGIVLESIGAQTSAFRTSNADVNRLFENAVWGQRGNFLAVPTDCPQRDERMGWTGDAQVFARAATYNMNIDAFYTRWLYTLRDDQAATGSYGGYYPELGPPPAGASRQGNMACGGWMEVGVIIPWQMYQQYGDLGIVEAHYPSMLAFMDYLERNATNYIQPSGGTGDWLAPVSTHTMLTNTAYSAYAALLMERMATALGKDDDAKRFHTFYNKVKEAFCRTFVNDDGLTVVPAEVAAYRDPMMAFAATTIEVEQRCDAQGRVIVDTQTSYVLPLYFGLLDGELKEKAVSHLVDCLERSQYTLTTGFVGTPYICLVLSDNGHEEEAYRLFTQTEYPSWLFPVKQGATTFWERWNSYTVRNGFGPVSMNSFNHYAYGAIEEWMMSHLLGIQRDETQPGYKHILLQPEVGQQLDYAEGGFETMYGRVESAWRNDGATLTYRMTVPTNTTATISLPTTARVEVLQGREGITAQAVDDATTRFEVTSGSYAFRVKTSDALASRQE